MIGDFEMDLILFSVLPSFLASVVVLTQVVNPDAD